VSAALEQLLRHPAIWRPRALPGQAREGLATGFPALDRVLPEAGWPMGALTEILTPQRGVGELGLLMPALARLSAQGRWLAWVAPPYVPYAPALASRGIDLARLLWVRARHGGEQLWAAEQALTSGACGAVLMWLPRADHRCLRRLQLAAESGDAWAVLFRRTPSPGDASPAALRLQLEPVADGLAVEVLKCRGGSGGRVKVVIGDS
jgi:hypothetical protein